MIQKYAKNARAKSLKQECQKKALCAKGMHKMHQWKEKRMIDHVEDMA